MGLRRGRRVLLVSAAFGSGAWAADPDPADGLAPARAPVVEAASQPVLLAPATVRYPPEAVDTHGDVLVHVEVDATGTVVAAQAVSGHAVFWEEAVRAAQTLRFSPAMRGGAPVSASLDVAFHFAPPDPTLGEDIAEIVVEAVRSDDLDTHTSHTLDADALHRALSDDLAETVARIPGVTLQRGTTDAAKPMIRGQTERRLLLLYDGVRHESQKWGSDHAPEIDPFAAGEIRVVQGAAGVRYGPDAIGGVILVEPPTLLTEAGTAGKVVAAGATNGSRGYGAARVDVGTDSGWSGRVEGDVSRSAALSTPDYVLGNTGSEVWNAGAALAWRRRAVDLRLTAHHYDFRAGVFYGVQLATPELFAQQLAADRPVSADLWETTAVIDRPYQAVQHDIVTLHAATAGPWGRWSLVYAFQHNQRDEFEAVRGDDPAPQYAFTLRTHSVDLALTQDVRRVGALSWSGGWGAQGVFQENVYGGLPLLPNYRSLAGGVFAHQRLTGARGAVEAGLRYDHLARDAFLSHYDFEKHVRRGTLTDTACAVTPDTGVADCAHRYDTGSATLGGLWTAIPEVLDWKFDLSTASRFPNADELYLIGSAPSFPVYAYGSPDLRAETTWGASTSVIPRLRWLTGSLSAYAQHTDNFIYFAPERDLAGEVAFDVTVRGAFPRWSFQPVDANFVGADGGLDLLPAGPVGLGLQGAVIRGWKASDGDFLVGLPPDQATVSLDLRPPAPGAWEAPSLELQCTAVARQSRVDPRADVAPAPAGYALLGASASVGLRQGVAQWRVQVEGRNLLNARYREYTSLMRYYANQPGRDLLVRLSTSW